MHTPTTPAPMRTGLIALAIGLAAPGCVSKTQYTELESMYQAEQDQVSDLQAQNARMKKELERRDAAAKRRLEGFRELLKELKPLIDREVLEVAVDGGRITLGMASDVLFASGSAQLSEEGGKDVQTIARLLAKRTDRDFQVEGHTDSEAISGGDYADNWDLGAARAMTVVATMVDAGMPAGQISAATFGQHRPVAPNSSDLGKAKNRRIEIVLTPNLDELPDLSEIETELGGK